MPSPLQQFQGVEASTDAQKAALGNMIAAQGSAGVESYKAQQKVAAAAIAPARASVTGSNPGIGNPGMAQAVGPGQLTRTLAARAAQPATLGAYQGGQAANEFASYTGFLGEANNNYMDAVGAAAPIVASQTGAEVAKINARAASEREAAQRAADDAATDRDWQRIQRQWAIEDRMLEEAAAKKALEEEDPTKDAPWKSSEAGEQLGWNRKTTSRVTQARSYQLAYPNVLAAVKALGPGVVDEQYLDGLVAEALRNVRDPTSGLPVPIEPGTAGLIKAQLRRTLGLGQAQRVTGKGGSGGGKGGKRSDAQHAEDAFNAFYNGPKRELGTEWHNPFGFLTEPVRSPRPGR